MVKVITHIDDLLPPVQLEAPAAIANPASSYPRRRPASALPIRGRRRPLPPTASLVPGKLSACSIGLRHAFVKLNRSYALINMVKGIVTLKFGGKYTGGRSWAFFSKETEIPFMPFSLRSCYFGGDLRGIMIAHKKGPSKIESRSFENSYIPENPRTPKPLTFSKNRLRGAKIRSNISPVAKKNFRKNDFFFSKNFAYVQTFFLCICAQSLYNTYLKRFVKKNLKKKTQKKKLHICTKNKKKLHICKRFRSRFFERNNGLGDIGNLGSSRIKKNTIFKNKTVNEKMIFDIPTPTAIPIGVVNEKNIAIIAYLSDASTKSHAFKELMKRQGSE
ncbi:hypothetical protein LXL04_015803 [Taraxacum kok-saghyz]